jgi:hypothetical protein
LRKAGLNEVNASYSEVRQEIAAEIRDRLPENPAQRHQGPALFMWNVGKV